MLWSTLAHGRVLLDVNPFIVSTWVAPGFDTHTHLLTSAFFPAIDVFPFAAGGLASKYQSFTASLPNRPEWL